MALFTVHGEDDGYIDPYKTIYAVNYNDINANTSRREFKITPDRVEGLYSKNWLMFKDVNFDRAPKSVDLHLGVGPANAGIAELRLDAPDGRLLLSVNVKGSDWDKGIVQNEVIKETVRGVHDLYFVIKSETCHVYSMIFYTDEYIRKVSPYVSYEDAMVYSDISESPYFADILAATDLGLIAPYSGDMFKPDMPVTRAELAQAVCSIMNLTPKEDGKFEDVSAEVKNYGEINAASDAGYLLGKSDTQYEPLSFFDSFEASVVSVRMLGYEKMAAIKGGYPYGYRVIANDLGIMSGLDSSDVIRRGSFARWIMNTINATYSTITSVENGNAYYEDIKGILSMTKNIKKGEGVVEANAFTSIYAPDQTSSQNYVTINDSEYYCENTYAPAYLGINCDFYYTEENGRKTIVSIVPEKRTVIKSIFQKDFTKIDNTEISYKEDETGKTKTLKTNAQTSFLVNGKALNSKIENIITAKSFKGGIIWIDNNGDNTADTVIVNSPETFKLTTVYDNKIADNERNREISLTDCDVIAYSGSEELKLKEIPQNTVATVFESKNTSGKKLVKIYVLQNPLQDTVSEKTDKGIILSNRLYKTDLDVTAGDSGLFYIDKFGYAVYYEKKAKASDSLGLYLGYNTGGSNKFSDKLEFKFYTESGKLKVYKAAESITADGYKFKDYSAVVSGSGAYSGIASLELRTPVRYRLNANDEITMIDTIILGTNGDDDKMTVINRSGAELYYRPSLKIFTVSGRMKYPMREDGTVFKYSSNAGIDDENDYAVKKASALTNNEIIRSSQIYSSDNDDVGNIVIDANMGSSGGWQASMFVTGKSVCIDSNGEETFKIEGYVSGKKNEFTVNRKSYDQNSASASNASPLKDVVDNLETGDIIKYYLNSKSEITTVKAMFKHDGSRQNKAGVTNALYKDDTASSSYWGTNTDMTNQNYLGKVSDKESVYIKLESFSDGTFEYIPSEKTSVIKYNCADGTYETGLTSAAVSVNDTIVAGMTNMSINLIVIYENIGF